MKHLDFQEKCLIAFTFQNNIYIYIYIYIEKNNFDIRILKKFKNIKKLI
jgi:hypothetical protein